jgi:protein involved in polysaccharide export with SLBB domain
MEALGGSRVSDVLRPSALLPGASRRNILVRHRDGSAETADLERLFRLGDHSRDSWLRDGDAIVVPTAAEYVDVSGAVRTPGAVELAAGDSASTLLRLGGGPLPAAAADGVLWIHWTESAVPETLRTNLRDLAAGTSGGPLANGDHLFVRFMPDFRQTGAAEIEGEVAHPGSYPVRLGGTRLSEVVAAAGGLLPSANASAIRVHRPRPESEKPDPDLAAKLQAAQRELSISEYEALQSQIASRGEEIIVDWTRLLANPASLDLLLHDADVVTVSRLEPSIRIEGQVVRPGVVSYVSGMKLEKYIEQAGGWSDRAWRGHEQVTRAGTSHTVIATSIKSLHPGDFIWVPTRPDVSEWRRSGELLAAMAQIATIIIAIRSLR